ncbi:MAG: DEAD/DEAH box helicase [Sphingomonadales bacterium]|jgi:superfamily II DNA or RNA helicase
MTEEFSNTVNLRDYQIAAVADIQNAIRQNTNCIVQLPTGTGKTTVIAEVIRNWRNAEGKNKRALIVAHRIELIDQIIERLKKFGVVACKIKAGEPINTDYQIQVGLIQSLRNDNRKPVSLGLIIVDEAHHITASSYTNLIEYYKNYSPVVVGFTATPSRLDGAPLGTIFKRLLEYGQINKFIEAGYLSALKHFATGSPNLKSIKVKSTGDYDENELQKEMSRDLIMANLIDGYEHHAKGKKMIVFAVNTYHAKLIADRYTARGYTAVAIDYTTEAVERKKIIEDFKAGKIQILCNVNLFTEGFDCPDVEVVQLARPTKSLNLYLQMVGRGMRIFPGKTHGIVLDNAKLWEEHGLVTRERFWTLDGLKNSDKEIEIVEKMDRSKGNEKESKMPEESRAFELIEIISSDPVSIDYRMVDSIKDGMKDDFKYLILSIPVSISKLINEIRFSAETTPDSQSINLKNLEFSFEHYLTNQSISIRDALGFMSIDIRRNKKTMRSKKLYSRLDIFLKSNRSKLDSLLYQHMLYIHICNWNDYADFVIPDSSDKRKFREADLKKKIGFFAEKKLFDEFDLPEISKRNINELHVITMEDVELIYGQIRDKYAANIENYINSKMNLGD